MSVSDLVGGLVSEAREDMADARANPGREVAETLILGLVGLAWLVRSETHIIAWLVLTDDPDPHPVATDWGVAASAVTAATAAERHRLGLATCLVGLASIWTLAPVLRLWQYGLVPGLVLLANAAVLVGDPVLVQVLPAGD